MTSILVKKVFEVESISVSPFCTKLSQTAGFLLIASVLFLSTKIFVQILCIKLSNNLQNECCDGSIAIMWSLCYTILQSF